MTTIRTAHLFAGNRKHPSKFYTVDTHAIVNGDALCRHAAPFRIPSPELHPDMFTNAEPTCARCVWCLALAAKGE